MNLSVDEICSAAGGICHADDRSVILQGISIDSRTIRRGELFIALQGEHFNGHDFVLSALKKGASGSVITHEGNTALREHIESHYPGSIIIMVNDTLEALQNIARFYLEKQRVPVVGITGSNGKTTVKEMAFSVLEKKYRALKSEGNLNNHIGLPLSILKMKNDHQVAILEMGMSGPGEIEMLCDIARPDYGIITNIAPAHMEELVSLEQIKEAKGELFSSLDEKGTGILNGDDQNVMDLKNLIKGRIITFGIENQSVIGASSISPRGLLGIQFTLRYPNSTVEVNLHVPGIHNVSNALAAAALGFAFNLDVTEVKEGLEAFRGHPMRMQVVELDHGITIINDAYNANPGSVAAAIETVKSIPRKGRLITLLGDMLELGENGEKMHSDIGKHIQEAHIDILITSGELGHSTIGGALEKGMNPENIFACEDNLEALRILKRLLIKDDILLIKGSRKMKMEEVATALEKRFKREKENAL